MVSTCSSFKRRLRPDIALASPSKRARLHQPPKPKPSPTTLPSEVRELILKELLWQEDPIEFNFEVFEKYAKGKQDYHDGLLIRATNPIVTFDPEILRTCKQLCAEGSKILYRNAVNCRVGRPFYGENFYLESDGPVVLSSRFSGMNLNIALNLPERCPRQDVSMPHPGVRPPSEKVAKRISLQIEAAYRAAGPGN